MRRIERPIPSLERRRRALVVVATAASSLALAVVANAPATENHFFLVPKVVE